jgi:hypothetical protein
LVAYLAAPRPQTGELSSAAATPAPNASNPGARSFFPLVARSDNRITGIVVVAEGNPVECVIVRLFVNKSDATDGRRAMARNWSGEDGWFIIDSVPPGKRRYLLAFINRPDAEPMHAELDLDIAAHEVADIGQLVLKRGRY